jgi:hypothetical protein
MTISALTPKRVFVYNPDRNDDNEDNEEDE